MKKVLLLFVLLSGSLFANQFSQNGCVETRVGEKTSIFSCPTGDYKVTFEYEPRKVATFEKIGEPVGIKIKELVELLKK